VNEIGYIAGIFTMFGILPQTIKTLRSKRTKDLSLSSFLIITMAGGLWTIYGFGKMHQLYGSQIA